MNNLVVPVSLTLKLLIVMQSTETAKSWSNQCNNLVPNAIRRGETHTHTCK